MGLPTTRYSRSPLLSKPSGAFAAFAEDSKKIPGKCVKSGGGARTQFFKTRITPAKDSNKYFCILEISESVNYFVSCLNFG